MGNDSAGSSRFSDLRSSTRGANALLGAIVAVVAVWSTIRAIVKPFWYDELCTLIVARAADMTGVWETLKAAADTNPPVFYAFVRFARLFIADEHLAYRFPSVIGIAVILVCLYLVLASRVDRISALIGATFVLCTQVYAYGFEARPYALMLAFLCLAILAWSRLEMSRVYIVVLALSLGFAVSMHYWAVLVWPAFVLGEAAVFVTQRKLRVGAWVALFAGAVPLLFWRPLMVSLKQYYGQNFWAHPSIMQIFESHDWLFKSAGFWGWVFCAAVTAAFLLWMWHEFRRGDSVGFREGLPEGVLVIALLWLPIVAVVVAKVTHGGMTERYMQPAILAAALIVGFLSSRMPVALRPVVLLLVLSIYGLNSIRDVQAMVASKSLYSRRNAAAHSMDAALAQYPQLPLVVSSGLQYLPIAYYHSAETNRRLYALTDPSAALKYAATDSIDLALIVLSRYYPLQVAPYQEFAATHREFLLLSNGGFDWWPMRLAADRQTVTLLSEKGSDRLYRVTLNQ